jgi:diguanylate cyclase (GGDEF)-like protein
MPRLFRFLLSVLIGVLLLWNFLSSTQSLARDLYLYNSIWILALFAVIAAPLSIDRVAIGAISLAIFFWGLGSLASSVDQLLSPTPRYTLATQLLYTLFYPLILIAIPRLSSTSARLRPIELLDSLIFGLGFTSIIASFLLIVIFPGNSLIASENFFAIFYPVGDMALLLISLTTLLTRGIDRQKALFLAGISIFAITDIYYLWLTLHNHYLFGSPAEIGWLIAIGFITFALSIEVERKPERYSPIHPALVAISIFISPILLAISALRPDLFPIYILIPSIANLLLAFIRMSTALREARILSQERILARTDELTGVANRRRLIAEIEQFSSVEGALLLLDLDGFKPVNDTYGHEVGDLLLRQVAERFIRVLPHNAIVARLGGDEFGILIQGSYEETLESAHALRASLTYPFSIHGNSILVGVSVGHAHNDGAGDLLKRADNAMYRAKRLDMGVAQS